MKKILALAIVAVMTVALFAVGAHAEDASVQQSNFDAVNATGPDLQFYGWVIIKGDDHCYHSHLDQVMAAVGQFLEKIR